MSASTVEMLTIAGARARRQELLDSVGGNESALRARGEAYALDAHELAVLDELRALDYLLRNDA